MTPRPVTPAGATAQQAHGLAALDRLIACEEAFAEGLESDDPRALEAALASLSDAVTGLATRASGLAGTDAVPRLMRALDLADAGRARLNALGDRNRRRLDKLADLAGVARPHAYTRAGRLG